MRRAAVAGGHARTMRRACGRKMRPMIRLLVVLAVVCLSTSSLAVRFATAPSVWLAFARLLLAAVILTPLVLTRYRRELGALRLKVFGTYAVNGVVLGLHFLCYFEAVKNTTIAAAVVLACSEVFFVAIGARILFEEQISARGWLSIVVAFLGCVLVTTAKTSQSPDALKGNLLGLLAAVLIAINTLIGKRSRKAASTTVYTFVTYAFAACTLLVATLLGGVPLTGYAPVNWLSALWLAVVCTMFGHSLISYTLKEESASFVSSAKLLSPVFAAVLGWLLFGEVPVAQVIIGSVVIIVSIYAYARQCGTAQSPPVAETIARTDNL